MGRVPLIVAPGVWQVDMLAANAFYVEDVEGGITLVDTGSDPGAKRIALGLRALGRTPEELRGVVVTHLHHDHTGGLATVKARTGAEVWMHAADAAAVRQGVRVRPLEPGPGVLRAAAVRAIALRPERTGEPVEVEHEVADGETLPFAGLLAVHTPGHTAGHLSLLLPRAGGVLFVGDAATNVGRLAAAPIYEDVAEGRRSLNKLAALDFEVACFAHGRTIGEGAAERFNARFGDA